MKYRPEIDGLRAVAVIPVILFHAEISAFTGGFVGVDVFFVISGYLITTIVLSEMEQGTFSLVNFYERRARRILPALFLVMLASFSLAWFWLTPSDMLDFSQSLVAVLTFSSNILFWRESGYWDAASEMKPLLHTWSLAVEEQYYILFPPFLMIMWRYGKNWVLGSLIFVAGISFVTAQWGAYYEPLANFYLLPTRSWEIIIGAVIAFYVMYKNPTFPISQYKLMDEILGLLGLLMIGYAIFKFDEQTPFPSFYTLIPTVGTGLIILFSSAQTMVGRLLGTKPFVAIGLISYSAYLWHQPLFVFARHRILTEPDLFTYLILASFSIIFAYLSWQYVEQPFRSKGRFDRKAIFSYSLIGSAIFMVIGLGGIITNGFDGRFENHQIELLNQKLKVNYGLSQTCDETFTLSADCQTDNSPEILIWGDSYAMHLVQGIMASNPDAKIIQMTKSVCGPFFDLAPISLPKYPATWAKDCLGFTAQIREWLKEQKTIKFAVLSSPFLQYLHPQNSLLLRNGEISPIDIELVTKEFEKTLNELKDMGITPVIFSPPPANGIDLGGCLKKAEWFGSDLNNCNFEITEMSQNTIDAYNFLKKFEDNYSVIFLDDFICTETQCLTHLDHIFIYRDPGHLSHEGSATLGEKYNFYKLITEQ